MTVQTMILLVKNTVKKYQKNNLISKRPDIIIKDRECCQFYLNRITFLLDYYSIYSDPLSIQFEIKLDKEIPFIPFLSNFSFSLNASARNKKLDITVNIKDPKKIEAYLEDFNRQIAEFIYSDIEYLEPKATTVKELVQSYLNYIEVPKDLYDIDSIYFNDEFNKIILPLKSYNNDIFFKIISGYKYKIDDLYIAENTNFLKFDISLKYRFREKREIYLNTNISALSILYGKFIKSDITQYIEKDI